MKVRHFCLGIILAIPAGVSANGPPADFCEALTGLDDASLTTLVERGDQAVYAEEIEAFLQSMPERHAMMYVHGDHVLERLDQLSLDRLIAADALESGLLADPRVRGRAATVISKMLADERRRQLREDDGADRSTLEARARELYRSDPERFRSAARVSFQHLLISSNDRSEARAARRVLDVYDQLTSEQKTFEALIADHSEDAAQPPDGYSRVELGKWPEKFRQVVNQAEPGSAVLGPFRTEQGWHLVRLNDRHPGDVLDWEESREQIVDRVETEYRADRVRRYIRRISEPEPELNESVLEDLRARYTPEN